MECDSGYRSGQVQGAAGLGIFVGGVVSEHSREGTGGPIVGVTCKEYWYPEVVVGVWRREPNQIRRNGYIGLVFRLICSGVPYFYF